MGERAHAWLGKVSGWVECVRIVKDVHTACTAHACRCACDHATGQGRDAAPCHLRPWLPDLPNLKVNAPGCVCLCCLLCVVCRVCEGF